MKFIDFFSGAGMFRMGMERAGHTCIGYVEINKYARQTYETNFDTKDEWFKEDIMMIKPDEIPKADVWCAGFPCQNLSTANVFTRQGLEGERSGLFWQLCYLLREVDEKPKYLFIENVQGFTTIRGGLDFLKALIELHSIGYDIKYEVSSAIKYNVPQNRIRTYLICTLNPSQEDNAGEEIPTTKTIKMNNINLLKLYNYITENNKNIKLKWGEEGIVSNWVCRITLEKGNCETDITLADILENEIEDKYYLNEEQLEKIRYMKSAKQKVLSDGRIWKEGAVPFPDRTDKHSRCITPSDNSLNRSTHIIQDENGYRKLTIRERARLQCLPDTFVFPVSDSQASLQIGNGVAIKVIESIARREIN